MSNSHLKIIASMSWYMYIVEEIFKKDMVGLTMYYHSTKQYREISRVGCPVLLGVRSASNNTVGNKRVMFPGNALYLW